MLLSLCRLGAVPLFFFQISVARADVSVRIDFTGVIVDLSPVPNVTHRTPLAAEFTLSGQNRVGYGDVSTRLGATKNNMREQNQQFSIGTSVRAGAVVFKKQYPKYSTITTIRTDGKSSCEASIDYFRKPGQKHFSYLDNDGQPHEADVFYAENVRCKISE